MLGLILAPGINANFLKITISNDKNLQQPSQTETNDVITFKKTYNYISNDQANSVKQTPDNGYILVGSSESDDMNERIWIVKTDENGNKEWNITYQKDGMDSIAYDVEQASDGGYIVVGSCGEELIDIPLVIKLGTHGDIKWAKTYNYVGFEGAKAICKTTHGDFVFTGAIDEEEEENYIVYLCKIDGDGNVLWKKNCGYGESYDVQQTSDGGYIIVGDSGSWEEDIFLIKTDDHGNKEWVKFYDENADIGYSVKQTSDGGYIIAGCTFNLSEDIQKGWVIKTDSDGTVMWDKKFGSKDSDGLAYDVCETSDGGFVVTGYRTKEYYTISDLVIIKYGGDGSKKWEKKYNNNDFDSGTSIQETSDGGLVIGGFTGSFFGLEFDYWLIKTDENGEVHNARQTVRHNCFPDVISFFLENFFNRYRGKL